MKLVYIEWCDATSNEEAWKTKADAIEWADNESWVCCNVGWLVKETKEYILTASKMAKNSDDLGCLFKIPKTWLRKYKVLKL